MRSRFTQSFKIQAVEKALNRTDDIKLKALAESLGVGYSTLETWIRQSRDQQLETHSDYQITSSSTMPKEKRPQDWSREEKLTMVITCGSLAHLSI